MDHDNVASTFATEAHAQKDPQDAHNVAGSSVHATKKPRLENAADQQSAPNSEEEKDRAQLLRFMEQKQRMEEEIKNLEDVLESQQGVGMSGQLLDAEGYPRADIDLYAVRYARNRIICLNNDHKALMKEIEKGLFSLHDKYKRDRPTVEATHAPAKPEAKPFLIVRTVTYKSPASDAGLKPDDIISSFGSLNYDNFKSVLDVKSICEQAHSANMPVLVKLIRKRESSGDKGPAAAGSHIAASIPGEEQTTTIHINLRPKTWSGPGLLGCYVEALPRSAAK